MRRLIWILALAAAIATTVTACDKPKVHIPTYAPSPSCPAGGDCDADAIVYGGFDSKAEFDEIWNTNTDIDGHTDLRQIYQHFGITKSNFDSDNTLLGVVRADGTVVVGNQVVASGVLTVGRRHDPGTAQAITIRGVAPVYALPEATTFLSASIPAWVYRSRGAFVYAVLESGGDPVIALPNPSGSQGPVARRGPYQFRPSPRKSLRLRRPAAPESNHHWRRQK